MPADCVCNFSIGRVDSWLKQVFSCWVSTICKISNFGSPLGALLGHFHTWGHFGMCLDQLCDSKYGLKNSHWVKNDWDIRIYRFQIREAVAAGNLGSPSNINRFSNCSKSGSRWPIEELKKGKIIQIQCTRWWTYHIKSSFEGIVTRWLYSAYGHKGPLRGENKLFGLPLDA